jgi:hypothetical protein
MQVFGWKLQINEPKRKITGDNTRKAEANSSFHPNTTFKDQPVNSFQFKPFSDIISLVLDA